MTNDVRAEKLRQPVQLVPAVGPFRAQMLARLGVRKTADLLFFFPRDYEEAVLLLDVGPSTEFVPFFKNMGGSGVRCLLSSFMERR